MINPGEYFLCKIDVPYGNGVTATVTLGDDVYGVPNITTGPLEVPGIRCLFLTVPRLLVENQLTVRYLADTVVLRYFTTNQLYVDHSHICINQTFCMANFC